MTRLEEVQKALESVTDDMDKMGALLDELNDLQKKAERGNVYSLAGQVDKMMPTLGFDPERDNDRLVASFSGGWQMRIGLGKILLQQPDLLLLVRACAANRGSRGGKREAACYAHADAAPAPTPHCTRAFQDEPTNHLDVEAIEWLEQYLKSVDVRAAVGLCGATLVFVCALTRAPLRAGAHGHCVARPRVPGPAVHQDRGGRAWHGATCLKVYVLCSQQRLTCTAPVAAPP